MGHVLTHSQRIQFPESRQKAAYSFFPERMYHPLALQPEFLIAHSNCAHIASAAGLGISKVQLLKLYQEFIYT